MKGKARKLLMAVIVTLFALVISGCHIGDGKDGMDSAREGGHTFLWYERHRLEDKKYLVLAAAEDGIYSYYYEEGRLMEVYFRKGGERTERNFFLPNIKDADDMGIDEDGNLYIFGEGVKRILRRKNFWLDGCDSVSAQNWQ